MTEYYRDWPIEIFPGIRPRATVHPLDGSAGIRLERNSEEALFKAVVAFIDSALIAEHVPMVPDRAAPVDLDIVEQTPAELAA
jgi:hypothetical protein